MGTARELIVNFRLKRTSHESGSQKSEFHHPDPLLAFPSLQEERLPDGSPRSRQGAWAVYAVGLHFLWRVPSPLKTSETGPKAEGNEGNTKSLGSCRGKLLPAFTAISQMHRGWPRPCLAPK